MSLVLQSSGGGSVTIAEPATASNYTATMPAATGTVMVSGNMPAFSAYQSGATSTSDSVRTKLLFQAEDFDTNSCYDTTLSRFTPNVAGYYLITGQVYAGSPTGTNWTIAALIYKNGAEYTGVYHTTGIASYDLSQVTGLIYMNGTTDYVEIYWSQNSGATRNNTVSSVVKFTGCLVRAA